MTPTEHPFSYELPRPPLVPTPARPTLRATRAIRVRRSPR
ncbi:hypothetical protein SUDANB148_02906 [Streptomyces sp. SudanB148_2056]